MDANVASARRSFGLAELLYPSIESAEHYEEAMVILGDVIRDDAVDAQTRELASNLRMSHTRNLIDRLDQVHGPSPSVFNRYVVVLTQSARPEARKLVVGLDSEYRRKLIYAVRRYRQR